MGERSVSNELVSLQEGQEIWVAYHLHKRCFSIRDAKTRKVVGYAGRIVLQNVSFRVYAAGRERVLRERKKNVHAYVQGVFAAKLQRQPPYDCCTREAYYNPYQTADFVDKETALPLSFVDMAICENGKVYYYLLDRY